MLKGIKIITLAANLPGPVAARRLRTMGATLVKVEPPAGDPMESYYPQWYRDMAEGQEVVRLDLKEPAGKEALFGLLRDADVLLASSRPSAMQRLGLDYEQLQKQFPALCMVSIVGYPPPDDNEPGHDLTYQARSGLINPPHMPRTLLSDMAGSEQAVSAVLALLVQRERSGTSGHAVVALSEAAAMLAEPLRYGSTAAGASLGGGIPEYNIYQALDGWIAVAALEPHFKARLESALKVKSMDEYKTVFAGKPVAYWKEWGQQMDVPIDRVNTADSMS